jgi:hypothetical protein
VAPTFRSHYTYEGFDAALFSIGIPEQLRRKVRTKLKVEIFLLPLTRTAEEVHGLSVMFAQGTGNRRASWWRCQITAEAFPATVSKKQKNIQIYSK